MAVTWNASTSNPDITLSNGNLTATALTGSGDSAGLAFGTTSQFTGNWYFEITAGGYYSAFFGVGFANSSEVNNDNYIGENTKSQGVGASSAGGNLIWFYNGATGTGGGAFATNDIIGIAVNITQLLAWAWNSGTGLWNNSSAASPAAGTGGVSIQVTGALYPAMSLGRQTSEDAGTANFGASAFSNTLPTGFQSWDETQGSQPPLAFGGLEPLASQMPVFVRPRPGLPGFVQRTRSIRSIIGD